MSGRIFKNRRVKRGKLILLVGTTVLLYILVSLTCNYDNTVIFTGDEWDYQSIGVNTYYGSEFLTTGRIWEIDYYKFTDLDSGKLGFWESFSGKKAYHRVPFYPLFLSITYRIFGINPVIVKYIQLFVLLISGLFLVLAGKIVWGNKGFWIGYLSFLLFTGLNYRFTEHLMPENWQFLFLAVIMVSLYFHFRSSLTYSAILGLALGFSCLNKGTTFLLFPIIIAADLYNWKFKRRLHWKNMMVFCATFALITGLWSVYISHEREQFTFLSAQTGEVLLDGNNEYCGDGLWHPEWRDRPDSFYNNDQLEKMPDFIRATNFYIKNPAHLSNFPAKLKAGFAPVGSFIALLCLYLIWLASIICRKSRRQDNRMRISTGMTISLLLLCISICFAIFSGKLNAVLFFAFVSLIFLLAGFLAKKFTKEWGIPFEFLIILLNFLIFTLVFYVCNETYPSRYVKTMDGLLILLSVRLLFDIIDNLKKVSLIYEEERAGEN